MAKKVKLYLSAILLFIISIICTLVWYDWKLLFILLVFVSANNYQNRANNTKD